MGANPSKKNNAFSSSALLKNEKVDKFLVQKPIKNGDGHRQSYSDFRKNSKLKNNCNFEFFSISLYQKFRRSKHLVLKNYLNIWMAKTKDS